MLILLHPNRDLLFTDINLSINKQDKIALIGNNGVGKSTLLKILAGNLHPSHGLVKTDSRPYYAPQIFGQFNDYSVAQALQIADKLTALILLEEAENFAKQHHCNMITITVISVRSELINWYERRGYIKTGKLVPFPTNVGNPKQPLELVELEKAI